MYGCILTNGKPKTQVVYSYWLMPDLDAHVRLAVGDQGDPLQQAGGPEGEPQLERFLPVLPAQPAGTCNP